MIQKKKRKQKEKGDKKKKEKCEKRTGSKRGIRKADCARRPLSGGQQRSRNTSGVYINYLTVNL